MISRLRLTILLGLLVGMVLNGTVSIHFDRVDRASAAELAQAGAETLAFDTPLTAALDDATFRRTYTFDGAAGAVITLSMTRVEGDLEPLLLLADADETILATSKAAEPSGKTDAVIDAFTLPADGRYRVTATRRGQALGSTTGTFRLLLQQNHTQSANATALRYGESALGQITRSAPLAFYFIRAQRGDVISVTMRRTSGDLDPRLDLATADGRILVSNDDDPLTEGTLDAAIRDFTVLTDAAYAIMATGYGETQGSFMLAVTRTPPEDLGHTLDTASLLDYGMTVEGSADEDVPTRYYRFYAVAGDVITVTVTATAGDLDPTVAVLNTEGLELARSAATTDDVTRIAAFSIPETAGYYLAAGRASGADGSSEGGFTLQLSGRPALSTGRALEIVYGSVVSGIIDSAHVTEEYVFLGEAGDVVRVTMERTSGDLDSLLTLYDRDRKQIAFDDDSGGDKDALIEQFTLPRDDIYILAASRYEREQGQTGGAYILSLERVRADD